MSYFRYLLSTTWKKSQILKKKCRQATKPTETSSQPYFPVVLFSFELLCSCMQVREDAILINYVVKYVEENRCMLFVKLVYHFYRSWPKESTAFFTIVEEIDHNGNQLYLLPPPGKKDGIRKWTVIFCFNWKDNKTMMTYK